MMKKYFWAAKIERVHLGSLFAANSFLPSPGQHHLSSSAFFFHSGVISSPMTIDAF